jgi:Integrase zinc binding domain
VDTEVPCFALSDERDLSLFHSHHLRTDHISDESCCHRHAQYGAHPSIDIDNNGLIAPLTEELPQVISHEEIRDEQSRDLECQELGQLRGKSCVTDVNTESILVRNAPGWIEIVVPPSLKPRLLPLKHFPVVAGHPGVPKMYASMRRKFFWKKLYKDVEETVRQCTVCAKNRFTERNRTSFLKLLPANGLLEFVSMDILGPLPKAEHGNRFFS